MSFVQPGNDHLQTNRVGSEIRIIQWATKLLFPKLKFMSDNSRIVVARAFCRYVLNWTDVLDDKKVLGAYSFHGEVYVERAINQKRSNVTNEMRKKFLNLYKGEACCIRSSIFCVCVVPIACILVSHAIFCSRLCKTV